MNRFMFRLFSDVGSKLAGVPVRLLLKKPYNRKAAGSCYVDFEGVVNVRVSPELWNEDKVKYFKVWLHEIGHAKRHVRFFETFGR